MAKNEANEKQFQHALTYQTNRNYTNNYFTNKKYYAYRAAVFLEKTTKISQLQPRCRLVDKSASWQPQGGRLAVR